MTVAQCAFPAAESAVPLTFIPGSSWHFHPTFSIFHTKAFLDHPDSLDRSACIKSVQSPYCSLAF